MYNFDGVQRSNNLGREPIRRTEVEVRVGELKNGEAVGEDEVTGEMVKGRANSSIVPEELRSVIVLLSKGKKERTECKNYCI